MRGTLKLCRTSSFSYIWTKKLPHSPMESLFAVFDQFYRQRVHAYCMFVLLLFDGKGDFATKQWIVQFISKRKLRYQPNVCHVNWPFHIEQRVEVFAHWRRIFCLLVRRPLLQELFEGTLARGVVPINFRTLLWNSPSWFVSPSHCMWRVLSCHHIFGFPG